jgi:LmbE family N-acetylglucosaminyl deacetylase
MERMCLRRLFLGGKAMSKVLVVAAHPDDEILGVGATIRKHVNNGDEAFAVILGEGQTSRWDARDMADDGVVESLHQDSYNAAQVIGYSKLFFENLPDNRFDSVDLLDTVKVVERYIDILKPDIVYTHHSGDLNVDHQITARAVLTASRPIGEYSVKEIYGFETVSSTEWNFGHVSQVFNPAKYIDVSDTFECKCEAMRLYKSELCEFPHSRSIKMLQALAEMRGGYSRSIHGGGI